MFKLKNYGDLTKINYKKFKECITNKVSNVQERTENLICLTKNSNSTDIKHLWNTKCSSITNKQSKDIVL